jgi:hypothetical protein
LFGDAFLEDLGPEGPQTRKEYASWAAYKLWEAIAPELATAEIDGLTRKHHRFQIHAFHGWLVSIDLRAIRPSRS